MRYEVNGFKKIIFSSFFLRFSCRGKFCWLLGTLLNHLQMYIRKMIDDQKKFVTERDLNCIAKQTTLHCTVIAL